MAGIRSSLSQHQYVFASAPYAGNLWIRDAPGGKSGGTSDPNWAAQSFSYLDNIVASQGPFDAIMGYSQGAAMTILYLSQRASSFRFAVTFCGGIPTVHRGQPAASTPRRR